jgi:SH3-like domain-containing protein
MSNHNYSKYSNNKNYNNFTEEVETVETVEDTVVETVEVPVVEPVAEPAVETVETVITPATAKGVVIDCARLNVRVAPYAAANAICTIESGAEVTINVAESTDEWFSVCTASGVEGYCMKRYINTSL